MTRDTKADQEVAARLERREARGAKTIAAALRAAQDGELEVMAPAVVLEAPIERFLESLAKRAELPFYDHRGVVFFTALCGRLHRVTVEDMEPELRKPAPGIAGFAGGPEPAPKPAASVVCLTCNDTHRMTLTRDGEVDHIVMCTRCPVPCQKCRQEGIGPFCEVTPCPCPCHVRKP